MSGSGRSARLEREPHPPGAATGAEEAWPVGKRKPHVAAACLNADDWTIDAVSEKTPYGPRRIAVSGAGGADGGKVLGSGNDFQPSARMHAAIFTDAIAEPELQFSSQDVVRAVFG